MSDKPSNDGTKFNAVWLAVGVGAGTAIGVALKNLAIGVAVGVAIGVTLAIAIPTKKKRSKALQGVVTFVHHDKRG